MARRWELPDPPWVLHSTPLLGNLTDRWIDTQVEAASRYGSRLLGMEVADGASPRPHWLVARDRLDLWLAYKARVKSFGLSPLWFLGQLRGRRPAVLHAHYGQTGVELLNLSRVAGCGLVTSFYGADATREQFTSTRTWRRRYALLFRHVQAVVVEGPAMGSRIAALGCDPSKVRVVRLPADASGLEAVPVQKAPEFRVVLAGRFDPKKGFELGIQAFARALGARTDARLVLVGGGPREDAYRRLVDDLGLGDRVVFAGRLPFFEFMREVATGHVALFPSRTAEDGDSEGGAPVTLIESQWLGVPPVVSSHDDLPFVAAPEGSQVLDTYDVETWAEVLEGLYEDPGRVDAMAEAARRHARTEHSPAANAAARERVYDLAAG